MKVFDMGRGLAKYEEEVPRIMGVPEVPAWKHKGLGQILEERGELEAVWDRVFGAGSGKPVKGGGA